MDGRWRPRRRAPFRADTSEHPGFHLWVTTDVWPGVYRACGNGADGFALDVTDKTSVWNWEFRNVNVPMEVYVR